MPYFRDGKRLLSFILVYKKRDLSTEKIGKLNMYLNNITSIGLELEPEPYSVDEDITFVKIHINDKLVLRYAQLFDLDIAYKDFEYRPPLDPPRPIFATPLTDPKTADETLYARAPESISGRIPTEITSAERIMVVYQILLRGRFGLRRGHYGFRKLLSDKIILDAFPLHDGPFQWTETGPLNDRQLLAQYWGRAGVWYKEQPLNLIEKYYGTEFALYFAWLGFYIKMLIPAAILSLLIVLIELMTMNTHFNILAEEVCNSDRVMCARCHFTACKMEYLRNSCGFAYVSFLFDNPLTVTFAVIMAIWSTVFMEMFQREQSVLQLQWNVQGLEQSTNMRPEFLEGTTYQKYSPITGQTVPIMTKTEICYRYTLTIVSVGLLLVIMLTAMILVMVYRVAINLVIAKSESTEIITDNMVLIASFSGATISAIFIFIFQLTYQRVAIALTYMENHRTVYEHQNSYIYKWYALSFVNNYAAVFYIAFFKGQFFTHPGDIHLWSAIGGLGSDVCNYTGCIVDLSILLLMIMTVKCVASNVLQIVVPKFKKLLRMLFRKADRTNLIDYEDEYMLPCTEEFFIVGEYMDMVIQYGFVTFFVVSFPLAPFLALCNNISEIRVDATKITKNYRRPVPSRVVGLGAWFGILQAMTYMGVVINALVIAFTSNFLEIEIYRYTFSGDVKGFINFTTSEYQAQNFYVTHDNSMESVANATANATSICYYHGKRNPPNHPDAYEPTDDYWMSLAIKFAVVVLFEHTVIILKGLLAYAIPDVPFSVRERVNEQHKIDKKLRKQTMIDRYMAGRKEVKEDIDI